MPESPKDIRWPASLTGLKNCAEELEYVLARWPVKLKGWPIGFLTPPWVSYEEEIRLIDEVVKRCVNEEPTP